MAEQLPKLPKRHTSKKPIVPSTREGLYRSSLLVLATIKSREPKGRTRDQVSRFTTYNK